MLFSFCFRPVRADSPPHARAGTTAFRRLFDEVGTVDQVGIEERVAKYTTRSIKKNSKLWGLTRGRLDGRPHDARGQGHARARSRRSARRHCGRTTIPSIPQVAAVCVYPAMVRHARRALGARHRGRIASVATAFPSGQAPLKTRLAEVRAAVADGADEIDMVINRGAFLAGEFARCRTRSPRSSRRAAMRR